MGFRNEAWATVWKVEKVSDVNTKIQLSVSKKNKQSGEYEQDFSGFVNFIGKDCAPKALGLKERDRIRLKEVDVSTTYNKEKKITYTNYKVFAFDSGDDTGTKQEAANTNTSSKAADVTVDEDAPW